MNINIKESTQAKSGVKIPAPIYYLLALFTGLVLDQFWSAKWIFNSWGVVVGTILIVLSILIMPTVLIRFKRQHTTFDVRRVSTVLITDGPFRYSRNPSYVAITVLYVGLGLVLQSFWIIVLTLPLLVTIKLNIIEAEERHLENAFGEDYRHYKSSVRRWL